MPKGIIVKLSKTKYKEILKADNRKRSITFKEKIYRNSGSQKTMIDSFNMLAAKIPAN